MRGNVSAQIGGDCGDDHPTYFFIDIQPDQAARFAVLVAAVDPAVRWVLAGDRGFTAAVLPPRGADIVAGRWWGEAPDRPLVSVEKGVADGLGLRIGDTVGINILGRAVADALPNVSAIRVADVLERVQGLSDVGGRAILAVTGVTLLAGLLVLGGAVSAGLRERLDQAVVLKVLGARRRDLMRATAWEFLSIRLVVGGFAVAAGASPDGRWCVT